ncbi:MAG TPA: hypothetical protein VMB85_13780, partial [Bryobacteraceae bacterium]|nr:hypothetical protein [Bryobacteraceae bacterium]
MLPETFSAGQRLITSVFAAVFCGVFVVLAATAMGASVSANAVTATITGNFILPIPPPYIFCETGMFFHPARALAGLNKRNHASGLFFVAAPGVKTAVAEGAQAQKVDPRVAHA